MKFEGGDDKLYINFLYQHNFFVLLSKLWSLLTLHAKVAAVVFPIPGGPDSSATL